ncbi:MAG TPA: hypothetical protein VN778_04785 [Verrucomicrobiae bacterium]|nr:hypothetical protein [Verrucomicrobiae bacterium]
MTIQELFIRSNEALRKSIDHIAEDQWDLAMPPGTPSKPTNLKDAVRYHTYDDAWVPDVLAGKSKEEVGDVYEPILKKEDIKASYDRYNERAIEDVQAFTELDRTVHLSYGDFPARDYLQHIISFRAFRSYDIAKLIGADTTMADDFVEALLAEFSPVVEGYRHMGVFPPAVEVADDASPQVKLLALVGRR